LADSFLTQPEQRTQQVKITLANLEAQKARIEGQIASLQPVIPHYDALLNAERALREVNIEFDEPEAPAADDVVPSQYVPSWESQHRTFS
jgi:predicted kinase